MNAIFGYIAAFLGLIVVVVIAVMGWVKYAKNSVKLETSEQVNREREHDAEILSKPFVDRPCGRMRPKSKLSGFSSSK